MRRSLEERSVLVNNNNSNINSLSSCISQACMHAVQQQQQSFVHDGKDFQWRRLSLQILKIVLVEYLSCNFRSHLLLQNLTMPEIHGQTDADAPKLYANTIHLYRGSACIT